MSEIKFESVESATKAYNTLITQLNNTVRSLESELKEAQFNVREIQSKIDLTQKMLDAMHLLQRKSIKEQQP